MVAMVAHRSIIYIQDIRANEGGDDARTPTAFIERAGVIAGRMQLIGLKG